MPSAGRLIIRIGFDKQVEVQDPDGGTMSKWVRQFERFAEVIPLRGGEIVQGQRLQGIQPLIVIVRRDSQTKLIDSDWRVVEYRDGQPFRTLAIKAPPEDMEGERDYLSMPVLAGTAEAGKLDG